MKNAVLRFISILLMTCAVLTMAGVVTVRGSGFLDLSNVARMALSGIAILCVVLAAFVWVTEDPREKRLKQMIVCIAIVGILILAFLAGNFRVPATEIPGVNG